MGVSKNGGTQQPWVFLLKMIILGCFGGTPIFGNTHIYPILYMNLFFLSLWVGKCYKLMMIFVGWLTGMLLDVDHHHPMVSHGHMICYRGANAEAVAS